ncbi:helix-turn-helix domain-containing protein [Actinoplanes xinjiangensis]|uniref:Helix-turn-helix protein n=1 Tax=Actinoplanes xinjiangensis TaxID=512350 RepID=A0A316E894_9ACTN|nr:helix-turn-helix transcriptional regulator [Actinoplanes xinjiangensis]PWK26968.1 helix-turn-helix protein [Actinoplanes xinjiangensis]GIF45325.1 transcriptional regulator [Actinoplanes xinjiangensis]
MEETLSLGEIIRQQRRLAELSMRQLAGMVGISNPYLSQIERGLRAPSQRVLHAIAASLRTTADSLVAQAEVPEAPDVLAVIAADPNLTARQRQALGEVYRAMTEATITRRGRRSANGNGKRPGA